MLKSIKTNVSGLDVWITQYVIMCAMGDRRATDNTTTRHTHTMCMTHDELTSVHFGTFFKEDST